jgi:hypothetical protein
MLFTATRLADACLIDIERRHDVRGFVAITWPLPVSVVSVRDLAWPDYATCPSRTTTARSA